MARNVGITRRSFMTSVGAATVAPVVLESTAAAASPHRSHSDEALARGEGSSNDVPLYLFFNAQEVEFIEAACERLIPADEIGPGALDAWVPNYLDKQLGGAWGAGERLYRSGPWQPGTPMQGYQLPFTPAELFHTAIRAINNELEARHTSFARLSTDQQDAYLKDLEATGKDLDGVPSAAFFEMLLQMTIEGYFSDPVYGGNRDMAAWKMIGFPGAYANYYETIDHHGVKFERAPMSIGDDRLHHVHVDPNIPASL